MDKISLHDHRLLCVGNNSDIVGDFRIQCSCGTEFGSNDSTKLGEYRKIIDAFNGHQKEWLNKQIKELGIELEIK